MAARDTRETNHLGGEGGSSSSAPEVSRDGGETKQGPDLFREALVTGARHFEPGLRFYTPQSGSILLDDRDLGCYRLDSLRGATGVVFQETLLFTGSVRENILFGRPDASLDEVRRAARVANAEEFIVDFPRGFESEVGERGVRLSVGQKQRIAIARVALRDPSLLILDEATSALDAGSERLVREALERVMTGRTCFVIAHRLATVVGADQILLLDQGRLSGCGRHADLLESSPLYHQLCQIQFADALGDSAPAAAEPS